MSYQREKYQEYLNANGIHNTSPYCSCLDKIEKTVQADIDKEYDTDKCEELLKTLLELRGNASDDAKKYGQIKNLMSKLNKYCQFRENPNRQDGVTPAGKKETVAAPLPRCIVDEPEDTFFFNANKMTVPMGKPVTSNVPRAETTGLNTKVDKKLLQDFKDYCAYLGYPMNVVLETFMQQYNNGRFHLDDAEILKFKLDETGELDTLNSSFNKAIYTKFKETCKANGFFVKHVVMTLMEKFASRDYILEYVPIADIERI